MDDGGSYKMLHLMLDVEKKKPDEGSSGPGDDDPDSKVAYERLLRVFSQRQQWW